MTFILLPHHCQGVQRVGIFPGRSLWKATENTKCLCIIHFHIVITAVSPGLKALSKNMLNRKMVFRVTKSQSMKDKLSFI